MILTLNASATLNQANALAERLRNMQFNVVINYFDSHYNLAIINGIDEATNTDLFKTLPHVSHVAPFRYKYKLASKQYKEEQTVIEINGHRIGDGELTIIAGSCSVESKPQIFETAKAVSQLGATILRGGAFKPRTSPYDFQGLGELGLQLLREASNEYHMLCISEVMDTPDIELVSRYVDILQVGARNMQNFSMLKHLGRINKPILLKRGLCATYNEFLSAAEYIISEGNPNVILCERGIRTFETYCRNTLDIAAIPALRQLTHLPIMADPSHGTGIRELVTPMACAAVAAGTDGLMVEVHPDPDNALSDAAQTISPAHFAKLMQSIKIIKEAIR